MCIRIREKFFEKPSSCPSKGDTEIRENSSKNAEKIPQIPELIRKKNSGYRRKWGMILLWASGWNVVI